MIARDTNPEPSCQPSDPIHGQKPALPLDEKALEKASRLFRALSDVPRLKMLSRLANGEVCVTELAAAEGESMAVISQRLRVLRGEDLVTRRRSGKHVFYALADQHVLKLFSNAVAHASEVPDKPRASPTDLDLRPT